MITARGLGRPGSLIVSGGLGRFFYEAPNGQTYVHTGSGWELVTAFYVYTSGAWVVVPDLHIYKSGSWTQVW